MKLVVDPDRRGKNRYCGIDFQAGEEANARREGNEATTFGVNSVGEDATFFLTKDEGAWPAWPISCENHRGVDMNLKDMIISQLQEPIC